MLRSSNISDLIADTVVALEGFESLRHQLFVALTASGRVIVHNVDGVAHLADMFPTLPIVRIRPPDNAPYWTLSTPEEVARGLEESDSIDPCPPTERAPND